MAMSDDDYFKEADKTAPASRVEAAPAQTAPAASSPTSTADDDYWREVDKTAPKSVVPEMNNPQPPPSAREAFRAAVEHAMRSNPLYRWAYDNLPALKQSDERYGYTPLSDDQYNQRYGDNGIAKTGQLVTQGLMVAPALAATEVGGGALAAALAAPRLVAGAPTVLRAADPLMGTPAVTSLTGPLSQVSYPWLATAARVGTDALQGLEGAAATGGNLLYGALGGAAARPVAAGVGAVGNSGVLDRVANSPAANALLHAGGALSGLYHGGLSIEGAIEAALGERIAGLTKYGLQFGNWLMRNAPAVAPIAPGPVGAASGQVPIPAPF